MKSTIVFTLFSVFFFAACTKSSVDDNGGGSGTATIITPAAVPPSTIAAFSGEFTGATGVEWQRNSSNSFTVQFNQNNQRHDAGYDDNGHRSSHSIICLDGPVPQVVLDAFRLRFAADNVYEWNLRNDGSWKAHFMRGTVKYEATYTATGTLLKFERAS